MASGGPPYVGRWSSSDMYTARLDNNFTYTPFSVSWSPVPAGVPFTTGSYSGVDFTASATFTVSSGSRNIEYVVVAGGGGGDSRSNQFYSNGGGGAGGFRSNVIGSASGQLSISESPLSVGPGTYTVTVGGGGVGAFDAVPSTNGSPSVFGSITSTGGGNGRSLFDIGSDGGSGGGGAQSWPNYGRGTAGQGFPAGTSGSLAGAGGGGAGGVGKDGGQGGFSSPAGDGGVGITTYIKGSALTLAGGGGGGSSPYYPGPATGGLGGAGGGGNGGGAPGGVAVKAVNGTANTGGGAGGSNTTNVPASFYGVSTGGSGRVIIRWVT